MANILISGFEAKVAEEISIRFRALRHLVHTCDDICDLMEFGRAGTSSVDLLIFKSSAAVQDARAVVDVISKHFGGLSTPPALLFIATVYRGPRLESELSRKGAHLVYVF